MCKKQYLNALTDLICSELTSPGTPGPICIAIISKQSTFLNFS